MSRFNDDEPEEWRTALPMRSPGPLVLALVVLQIFVLGLLILYGVTADPSTQTPTHHRR